MPDAGEIKAKVVVEYDGSGVEQAKKDLSSLADAAGSVGEGTGSASEGLNALDEQVGKSTEGVGSLNSAFADLPKMVEHSGNAVTAFGESLTESRDVLDSVGESVQNLRDPLESTVSIMGEASRPMSEMTRQAEVMSQQLTAVNDGFSQMGETLTYSEPAGAAQAYTELFNSLGQFEPGEITRMSQAQFGELTTTGRAWEDFSSSVTQGNAQMLAGTEENSTAFANMGKSANASFTTVSASSASADHAVAQFMGGMKYSAEDSFSTVTASAADAEKAVSEFLGKPAAMGAAAKGMGFGENVAGFFGGIGEGVSGAFGGVLGALNDIAMPLMAVQMIGMAVQAVGQSMYDAAAIAEGPAAHSFGTFTGAVDTLNKSAQGAWQTFSEGAGKGLTGTIDAINNVNASNKNGNDFWGALGESLGMVGGGALDIGAIVVGGLMGGIAKTLTLNPENTFGNDIVKEGWYGLQNTWANFTGAQEPYPGPMPPGGSSGVDMGKIEQSLATSAAAMQAQASDPTYLAAQAYLGSQQGKAQLAQAQYDTSHYTGVTGGPTDPYNAVVQYELNRMNGVGGLGANPDPNAAFFNSIPGIMPGQLVGGCFIAGTRVLMADGSERGIETLHIGEQVLAHDGTQQVTTTIIARIVPPPKKVCVLSFDDGTTLTLTDSHPISTRMGWKSLHPRATREENPDLAVSTLCIGDTIHTANGTVKLVGILPCEVVQIYNLTVDEPHTFYANKILVHNKVLGGSMGADGTGDQQVSLSHTFTANITWEAQNLNKSFTAIAAWAEQGVQHAVTAVANWAEQGVIHPVIAVAQWAEEGVMHGVTAIAQWAEEGVMHGVTAIANWTEQGLAHAAVAIANWSEEGVQHNVIATAQWIEQDLEHLFTGKASWIGEGLEHTFNAMANWTAQNLTPSFTVNPSVSMFAEGTSNFSGGPAIVGEAGPEVVGANGQYSLFNQGASLVNLPAGASVYPMRDLNTSSPAQFANGTGGDTTPISLNMGGNSAPQSFNISLHVNDQAILSAFGVPLVQNVRLYSGQRGY